MPGKSVRNIRRLISTKKKEFVQTLNEVKTEKINIRKRSLSTYTYRKRSLSTISSENIILDFKKPLHEKLKEWIIRNKPTRQCVEELLVILKEENLEVPLSLKTLFPNKQRAIIKQVSPGFYSHFGIKAQLNTIGHLLSKYDEVVVDINIDGIPLFKSSKTQLWPILFRIVNVENISIIPIGIYLGKYKPTDISEYLHEFILEMKNIMCSGIELEGKILQLKVRAIVCDSPAKAFLCGIPGHTSSHGCSKCIQVAQKIKNVLTYSTTSDILLTDADFEERKYKAHHKNIFHLQKTPLEKIGVKMITQIALDSMHLVDLGVMRKFIMRIIKNKTNFKVSKSEIDDISNHLKSLNHSAPKEFVRRPRGLEEILNWKATEYRQVLLYTGIFIFKDKIPVELYNEFLLLHCSCRLLSTEKNLIENIQLAENMLKEFVQKFSVLFGENSISHNIHSLLHLSENVKEFGILQKCSAYDFENYLQILKKYVRQPTNILQQIFNQIKNEKRIFSKQTGGFVEKKGAVEKYYKNDCLFTNKSPENMCYLTSDVPFKIKRFNKQTNSVVGHKFNSKVSFFQEPIDSIELGICLVGDISLEEEERSVDDIQNKVFYVPYKNQYLIIPLLHGCF